MLTFLIVGKCWYLKLTLLTNVDILKEELNVQGCSRLGKFFLSRWKFYEENVEEFSQLSHYYKSAIRFFKCLKMLDRDELELLAQRWYVSNEGNLYSIDYDTYETIKPIPYEVIADIRDETVNEVQVELRRLEKKLGAFLFKEQHGREWYEERPKTEWCTNCESFMEIEDRKCVKCKKELFNIKEIIKYYYNVM